MGHLPHKSFQHNRITLTDVQQEILSEGLPLQLVNEQGELIAEYSAFQNDLDISTSQLLHQPDGLADFEDAVSDAADTIALLQSLIVNQNSYLELDEQSMSGLSGIFSQVRKKLEKSPNA